MKTKPKPQQFPYCPKCRNPLKRGCKITDGSLALKVYFWNCWRCGWRQTGNYRSTDQVEPKKEPRVLWRGWAWFSVNKLQFSGDVPYLSSGDRVETEVWKRVVLVED